MPEDIRPLTDLQHKTTPVDDDLVPILDSESVVPSDRNKLVKVSELRATFQGPQGEQGETGEAGADGTQYPFLGEWTTGTAYVANDCVEHDGSGYVCMESHTAGVFETDLADEKWRLLVEKGEGTAYPWQGPWMTTIPYAVNDCVEHEGSAYVCVENHTSGDFEDDLADDKWNLLTAKGEKGDTGEQGETGSNVNLTYGTSDTPPGGAPDGTLHVVYIA